MSPPINTGPICVPGLFLALSLLFFSSSCPLLWCFLSSVWVPAVGLLWVTQPLMSSCKHCDEINVNTNVYLLSDSLLQYFPSFCPSLISSISLSSHAVFSAFLPFSLSPITTPPPFSLLSPLLPPNLIHSLSLSLPLCAQDRSALITLMAMMMRLNGALSPRCLSKAFLCSSCSSSSIQRWQQPRLFLPVAPAPQPCDLLMWLYWSQEDYWAYVCFI